MKNFFLHLITPIVNCIVYLVAYVLCRAWSYILGFLSSFIPRQYETNPGDSIWTIVCSAFGMYAIALLTSKLAPSGRKAHFLSITILIEVIFITSICLNYTTTVLLENIGNIGGIIAGYIYLKSEE